MVRAQGGTEAAVRLGLFSRDFYAGQQDRLGIDSGFVAQGYFMPCFTPSRGRRRPSARIAMQQALGLDVRWVGPDEFDAMNPAMAPRPDPGRRPTPPGDGYIDPPRNVLAYTAALFTSGVEVLERTAFTGLLTVAAAGSPACVRPAGDDRHRSGRAHRRADPGRGRPAAGVRIPAGGARHQVVVTEPHPDLAADRLPMVFDVASGIYWRPEEGGVLWGMSNPDEPPGEATRVRLGVLRQDARRGWRRCCRATAELGPAQGLGRDHRLHPRPPADPRPG